LRNRCWLLLVFFCSAALEIAEAQDCPLPPVAQDDFAQHLGGTVAVDVLANDSEPDGEALSVAILSTTCNGSAAEDLGLVTMAPASAGAQDCTISYRVMDERGLAATATVTITKAAAIFADGFESGDTLRWSEEGGS